MPNLTTFPPTWPQENHLYFGYLYFKYNFGLGKLIHEHKESFLFCFVFYNLLLQRLNPLSR